MLLAFPICLQCIIFILHTLYYGSFYCMIRFFLNSLNHASLQKNTGLNGQDVARYDEQDGRYMCVRLK